MTVVAMAGQASLGAAMTWIPTRTTAVNLPELLLSSLFICDLSSHRFNLRSPVFAIQALSLRATSGSAGFTGFGCHNCTLNQVLESLQRFLPVLFLAAVFLSLDDNNTFFGNALVIQLQYLLLVAIG